MTKTMCKKTKEKRKKILAKEAIYECKKCKATAHKEKHLCKPHKVNY
jgi:hypothetical protein